MPYTRSFSSCTTLSTSTILFLSLHDALPICMMAQGVYRIPQISYACAIALTNTTPMGAFRGAGRPEAAAMLERIIDIARSEEHTSELQSHVKLVCRLLLEKKKSC